MLKLLHQQLLLDLSPSECKPPHTKEIAISVPVSSGS